MQDYYIFDILDCLHFGFHSRDFVYVFTFIDKQKYCHKLTYTAEWIFELPVFNINQSILAHNNAWKLDVGRLRHSLPPYFAI